MQDVVNAQRDLIELWRNLAVERGEQLRNAGIAPVIASEIETIGGIAHDIARKFSADEMRTLAIDIGIDPSGLQQDTAQEFAREIALAANRRGKLERLIAYINKERPGTNGPV